MAPATATHDPLADLDFEGHEQRLAELDRQRREAIERLTPVHSDGRGKAATGGLGPPSPAKTPAQRWCVCDRPAVGDGSCSKCGKTVQELVADDQPSAEVEGLPASGKAQALDAEIRSRCGAIRRQWIDLARLLHQMSEGHYRDLGHRRFRDYLAAVGLSRSQGHRLLRIHRRLVLEAGCDPDQLAAHDVSKLELVVRGTGPVDAEQAITLAAEHTTEQLQELYRNGALGPARTRCPECGAFRPIKPGRPPGVRN